MMTSTSYSFDKPKRSHHHGDEGDNGSLSEEERSSSTLQSRWKLYDNPFFIADTDFYKQLQRKYSASAKRLHRIRSHPDLRSFRSSIATPSATAMDAELDRARAEIAELKAEVALERKMRKKMEEMNNRVQRELAEERRQRRTLSTDCDELRNEISRMRNEMEEERKMLRMAAVIREERLQMKLADAQLLYHNKFVQEACPSIDNNSPRSLSISASSIQDQHHLTSHPSVKNTPKVCSRQRNPISPPSSSCSSITSTGESKRSILGQKLKATTSKTDTSNTSDSSSNVAPCVSPNHMSVPRKASVSLEPENPHIKQGIKGFVEFPRVLKAMGITGSSTTHSSSNVTIVSTKTKHKDIGSKLECQKAQLRVLLKHKTPLPSNPPLIIS